MFERLRLKSKKKSEDDKASSNASSKSKGGSNAPPSIASSTPTAIQPPPPLPLGATAGTTVGPPPSASSFTAVNPLLPSPHSVSFSTSMTALVTPQPASSLMPLTGSSNAFDASYECNYMVPVIESPWTNNDREKQEYDEERPVVQNNQPAPPRVTHIPQVSVASNIQRPPSLQQQQQQQQHQKPMVRMSIDPISHQVTYNTVNSLPQHIVNGAGSIQLANNGSSTALSSSSPPTSLAAPLSTVPTPSASIPASASVTTATSPPSAVDRRLSHGPGGSILGLPKSYTTRTQAALAAATAATTAIGLPPLSSSSSVSSSSSKSNVNVQDHYGSGTPGSAAASATSSPSPSRSSSTSNRAAMGGPGAALVIGEQGQLGGVSGVGGAYSEAPLSNGTAPGALGTVAKAPPSSAFANGAGSHTPHSVTPPLTPQMVHQRMVVPAGQLNNGDTLGEQATTNTTGPEQQQDIMAPVSGSAFLVQSPMSADNEPDPMTMPPLAQSTTASGAIPMEDSFLHNYIPVLTGTITMPLPKVEEATKLPIGNRSIPPSSISHSLSSVSTGSEGGSQNTAISQASPASNATEESGGHSTAHRDHLLEQQQAYQRREMQYLEQLLSPSHPSANTQQPQQQEDHSSAEALDTTMPSFTPTPFDDSQEYVRHGLNTTIESETSTGNGSTSMPSVQPAPSSARAPPIPRKTHPNYKDRAAIKGLGIQDGARVIITTNPPAPLGTATSFSSTSTSSTTTTTKTTMSSSDSVGHTYMATSSSSTTPSPPTPSITFDPGVTSLLMKDHHNRNQTSNRDSTSSVSTNATLVSHIAKDGTTPTASNFTIHHHKPLTTVLTRAGTQASLMGLITHDLKQSSEQTHIEEGSGPLTLIAIGKTGQGKSSLLNRIMGTSELKASASVRAVTKGIAERSGWGRFEDTRRVLVTLADTPGLADTEGDDEKNIPILKEYIKSIGTRLGVSAFLLVFKIDSGVDMVVTILTTFNEIMQEYPNFWENVVLVFTGCDYRRNVQKTKELYHAVLQNEINERFFKNQPPSPAANGSGDCGEANGDYNNIGGDQVQGDGSSAEPRTFPEIPMVFLTTAEPVCGFALGERCDCKAQNAFLNNGLRRLWYKVRDLRRWVIKPDCQEDDFNHS